MTTKTSVEIPTGIRKKLEETSEEMELDEEEIIDRAITMYLDMVNKEKDLKEEFSAWDKASDEALTSTEKSL
jgi:predicted transcriptional regulator